MAGAAFSLNRVRVTVTQDKLEQIADILEVSPAQKARIVKDGVLITAPKAPAGGAASARSARSSGARRTASRTTARTPRRRK